MLSTNRRRQAASMPKYVIAAAKAAYNSSWNNAHNRKLATAAAAAAVSKLGKLATSTRPKTVSRTKQREQKAPVAISRQTRGPNRRNGIRMRKREFVTTINGSTGFSTTKFQINPGLPDTFPWLHDVANEWQYYKIHAISAVFITRSATSAVGSVIISPEYNVYQPEPDSELVATNTANAVEDVTWRNTTCRLDPRYMHRDNEKYMVRSQAVSNLPAYDAAYVNVSTSGQTNDDPIGKLWLYYDIEFMTPQTLSASTALSTSMAASSAGGILTSGLWYSYAFNPNVIPSAYKYTFPTSLRLELPVGYWRIRAACVITTTNSGELQASLTEYANSAWARFGPITKAVSFGSGAYHMVVEYYYRSYVGADGVKSSVSYDLFNNTPNTASTGPITMLIAPA